MSDDVGKIATCSRCFKQKEIEILFVERIILNGGKGCVRNARIRNIGAHANYVAKYLLPGIIRGI
jgi:hypothetical protein